MVALAVLAPIVASQGGNAATQTMTVAVRALALRELGTSNILRVTLRETCVGLINGVGFGLLTGTAITAQTFSMFVREHTTQLAVCRVIGVTKARIIAMVLCQGLFVLSIGCAFGTGLTAITTHAAASEPFLRGIVLPPQVAAGTCAALAAITITAVTIMARRVALMDPAIVFRS